MSLATTETVSRLSRDLVKAAAGLTPDEARFLVDSYYTMQKQRIRSMNQLRALTDDEEPHEIFRYLGDQFGVLEGQVKRALDSYSKAHVCGDWLRAQKGIGPVIAAGLLAHLDIEQAPTVGHFWAFAGYDPNMKWRGTEKSRELVAQHCPEGPVPQEAFRAICDAARQRPENIIRRLEIEEFPVPRAALIKLLAKRPWNASLKTLCWKVGESFVKVSGDPNAFYGQQYVTRKDYETKNNEAGKYKTQAKQILEQKRIGKTTDAYKAYSEGKLPPAHIHARAKRWTVKLFLAHLHHEMHIKILGRKPPKPYALAHLDHAHEIPKP